MAKFIIEVPHSADKVECARAVEIFLTTGSHFLTNADWGCLDGDHKAWIMADLDTREEARNILPPAYRAQAKIIQLNKFELPEIQEMLEHHQT